MNIPIKFNRYYSWLGVLLVALTGPASALENRKPPIFTEADAASYLPQGMKVTRIQTLRLTGNGFDTLSDQPALFQVDMDGDRAPEVVIAAESVNHEEGHALVRILKWNGTQYVIHVDHRPVGHHIDHVDLDRTQAAFRTGFDVRDLNGDGTLDLVVWSADSASLGGYVQILNLRRGVLIPLLPSPAGMANGGHRVRFEKVPGQAAEVIFLWDRSAPTVETVFRWKKDHYVQEVVSLVSPHP